MNGSAYTSGMDTMAALGDLPILQDTTTVDAWALWGVTYRDVVLLDRDNRPIGVMNLTTMSLDDPANYTALRDQLSAAVTP